MAILLTQTGIFSSCSMDNDLINEAGNLLETSYFKVENASDFSNISEVIIMGYDRSTQDVNSYEFVKLARGDWKDGGFSISLPKTLNPNFLRKFTHIGWMPQSVIDVSPAIFNSNRNVKVGDVEFWGVDKDGYKVAMFFPSKIDEEGNGLRAFFMYANSDATISGFADGVITVRPEGGHRILQIRTIYSIEWKKGWNAFTYSGFESIAEETLREELSSVGFGSLKWHGRSANNIIYGK